MAIPTIKFYLDANVSTAVGHELRRKHIDAQNALEAGLKDETDEVHLAHAIAARRVIVTQDADFLAFHHQGVSHPGIVYFPQGVSIGHMVKSLQLIHDLVNADSMANSLEYM